MKFLLVCAWSWVGGAILAPTNLFAADTNPPPKLTCELGDGSRVVGFSTKNKLKFHSALLGEIVLNVTAIQSIECLASNSTRLVLAGGDTLTATMADSKFPLKTSFGKVDLDVNSIRKITVSSKTSYAVRPAGLVALWQAEGNAEDVAGNQNGIVQGNLEYGSGILGQAFKFASKNTWIKIPAATNLAVGADRGFTLEAWVNPTEINRLNPVFEWNNSNHYAVHFDICPNQPHHPSGLSGPGELYANIVDENGTEHKLSSPPFVVTLNQFQHMALTYDASTGMATIYHNARIVGRQNLGMFTPLTKDDLYLGSRPAPVEEQCNFAGLMDEVAIYNRPLTSQEIQQVYNMAKKN